ncbi:RAS1 protein [Tieghemiomyces parasiticus]|uniref:RAS1 protein n=1 Tax=Tieghemiomyces parasiticus TaxID=78921 RepID=A0A9W8AC00_9FUNG|nr:RAS1 protein [Tieghemiomyces parasiticus]
MPVKPNQIPREYKVVVLGAGGVGKSALTIRFVRSYFIEEYDPTIEDSYMKACDIDGEEASLDVLDSAGQEEYSVMREQYIRAGDGFLLVYSVSSRSSFDEVKLLAEQLLRVKDVASAPIVIVGNKCDLADLRQVETEEGRQLATKFQAMFLESSAKTRTNVDEAFHETVRQVRRYRVSAAAKAKKTSSSGASGQGKGDSKRQGSGGTLRYPTALTRPLRAKTKSDDGGHGSRFGLKWFGMGPNWTEPGHNSAMPSPDGSSTPPSRLTAKEVYYSEARRRASLSRRNANHEDNHTNCCTIF